MSAGPRILLVNDDGHEARGLAVLRRIAETLSDDVWVVAPEVNQSGAGHRFSLATELTITRREERVFSVDGTPADCVVAGMTHVLKGSPAEIVLSGINRGQNIADLINCSGTVAGAREAALQGALGIALSQSLDYSADHLMSFECAEQFTAPVVTTLIEAADGPETYFNVNFPRCRPHDVAGVRVVPHQRFARSPFEFYESENEGRFFVAILEPPEIEPGADQEMLLDENAITVTPLVLQQTDMAAIEPLQRRFAARIRGAA